jgi:hypothetical protein
MIKEVTFQGNVALDGSTRIICSTDKLIINSIIINNLLNDYTFTFNQYIEGKDLPEVTIYEFNLKTGDTIRDEGEYFLTPKNYLKFISDVAGTTYYAKGYIE